MRSLGNLFRRSLFPHPWHGLVGLCLLITGPLVCAAQTLPSAKVDPKPVGAGQVAEDRGADEIYEVGLDALAAGREDLAIGLFAPACAKGKAEACLALGKVNETRIIWQQEGANTDQTAIVYVTDAYSRACDLGARRGCAMLVPYLRVADFGMQDHDKAIALARSSCEAGEAYGCEMLSQIYLQGEGAAPARSDVPALFRRLCDAEWRGGMACSTYALMLARGMTSDTGGHGPLRYYRLGCRKGLGPACNMIAADYVRSGIAESIEIAAGLYEQGCRRGDQAACTALADVTFEHRMGSGFFALATSLYRAACEAGYGDGCLGLGNLARKGATEAGLPGEAPDLFAAGCNMGSGQSCYAAGAMYLVGVGVQADASVALSWFAKGCSEGSARACVGAATASRLLPEAPNAGAAVSQLWIEQARAIDPAEPLLTVFEDWVAAGASPEELVVQASPLKASPPHDDADR